MYHEDCFVCRKQRGLEPLPGGAIYADDLIFLSHSGLWGEETQHYLGHLFVETRRHAPGLDDLTEEEAAAVGKYTSLAARTLKAVLGVEHVYAFVIGDGVPHLHVHVIGRYPGAPREYWGPRVDEWPDAPKGGENDIADITMLMRNYLHTT